MSRPVLNSGRASGARIQELRVTPVAITDPPLLNAAGLHTPYALRIIVELTTADNITGISEIPGDLDTLEALNASGELIEGRDPFQLNTIRNVLTERFGEDSSEDRGDAPWDQRLLVHIFSSIEVACLDIAGKCTGRPVVDLLGGRMRDRVPFSAYLFFKHRGAGGEFGFETDPDATGWASVRQKPALTADGIVEQAKAMCDEFGFRSLKLKGGVFEPSVETAAVRALRKEFGPDMPIRFDPNAVWSFDTARTYGKKLESVLEYLEDPVRGQQNMARLRDDLNIPLATNMCTTSFEELPDAIRLGSEDIILSDHHFWGGLRSSMELSRICETFGRDLSMHSNSHMGISLAAMAHLGAALPRMPYALDTHYPWQSDEIVLSGRLAIENGAVEVPSEPGLGVELDQEVLKRLHQNYLECGLTRRDDETEMQKVEPGWTFQKIRW